jgi:hypothetical protein
MSISMLDMTVADSSGPPPGPYRAEFLGVTQTTHAEYGEGALFSWKVIEGEHKGKTASRTCKPVPSAKNVTGKLVAGLVGGQLTGGQKVSLASCVGKVYTIVVGLSQNGNSTRVEAVIAS